MPTQLKMIYAVILVAGVIVTWGVASEFLASQKSQAECANQLLKNPSQWKQIQGCTDALVHAKTAAALGAAVLPKP